MQNSLVIKKVVYGLIVLLILAPALLVAQPCKTPAAGSENKKNCWKAYLAAKSGQQVGISTEEYVIIIKKPTTTLKEFCLWLKKLTDKYGCIELIPTCKEDADSPMRVSGPGSKVILNQVRGSTGNTSGSGGVVEPTPVEIYIQVNLERMRIG